MPLDFDTNLAAQDALSRVLARAAGVAGGEWGGAVEIMGVEALGAGRFEVAYAVYGTEAVVAGARGALGANLEGELNANTEFFSGVQAQPALATGNLPPPPPPPRSAGAALGPGGATILLGVMLAMLGG